MKIIEALKELPLIDKKIAKNIEFIKKYSAAVNNGRVQLFFADEATQKAQVQGFIQSNVDLIARKAALRRQLSLTNATVQVTISGQRKTIAEWIEYRQHGLDFMKSTYGALDDTNANRVAMQTPNTNPAVGVTVVRFYEEEKKNQALAQVLDTQNSIDTSLEITNATTDLVEAA